MPPKKIEWGDIPKEEHVKEKDSSGKWIECYVCQQVNKVRATFSLTEWLNHCSSAKHCKKVKTNDLNNTTTKMTSYFASKPIAQQKPSNFKLNSNERSKSVLACPGFSYTTSKKNDELGDATFIVYKDGKWSIHSNKCTNKAVSKRSSKRMDKTACQKCFDFPNIPKIKDRVKEWIRFFI